MALGRRSPLTVAGAAVALFRESRDSRSIPHSLIALLRETIDTHPVHRRECALSMAAPMDAR